jgi:hypothetical protein
MKKIIPILLTLLFINQAYAFEQYASPNITILTITGTGNTYSAWQDDQLSATVNRVCYRNLTVTTDTSIFTGAFINIARVSLPNTYTANYGWDTINPFNGYLDEFFTPCEDMTYTAPTRHFYFNLTGTGKALIVKKTWRRIK